MAPFTKFSEEQCVAAHDKNPNKAWACDSRDLAFALLASVLGDGGWHHLPELAPGDLLPFYAAQAVLGLPRWLLGTVGKTHHAVRARPRKKQVLRQLGG